MEAEVPVKETKQKNYDKVEEEETEPEPLDSREAR